MTKASATLTKMAMMTDNALLELSRSDIARLPSADILSSARTKAPPKSSNTSDTVVDVGIPCELNTSSTITSVTITARNSIITSRNEKYEGCIMPCRATSIIPADSIAPAMIPTEATMITVRNRATFAPMAEFIKLTASLLTPTNKSTTASTSRNTIIIR